MCVCVCAWSVCIHRGCNAGHTYDLLVVGGGIVGMATAREVALRYPNMSVCLVEKEDRLGMYVHVL